MIKRLLIANRGEIACRIIRTAKALGIETIAIYAEPDRHAQHVQQADLAVALTGTTNADTYLNIANILAIAQAHNADAIHPGYGFLSENSRFAADCAAAGIIFVGPTAEAIDAMGDKALAKRLMQRANVPTIPGYEGDDQSPTTLQQAADAIGYPVLIKAAGGGGGKGMRLCHTATEFLSQLQSAQQEALASFHNERVILEKYLSNARHVEIQLFADHHGAVVYLFSRDCSVQRRHQKIIEEAPAPGLPERLLARMGEAAVQAAKAIHYRGAGTIEFLVDAEQKFYFMEMNTRLQVEHPVTEQITGQDLVAWQLNIAAGERLPLSQAALQCQGHSIEVRVCAENPRKGFIPATGTLTCLHFPPREMARVDSGFVCGDAITPYYDSLLAKIIVHAENRPAAIEKLKQALEHTYIAGVDTNVGYLHRLLEHPAFRAGQLSTEFITEHQATLQTSDPLPDAVLALATVAEQLSRQQTASDLQQHSAEPNSPWLLRDHWRQSQQSEEQLALWWQQQALNLRFCSQEQGLNFSLNNAWHPLRVIAHNAPGLQIEWQGQTWHGGYQTSTDRLTIFYAGEAYVFHYHPPITAQRALRANQKTLLAPMPSTVIEIFVKEGDSVAAGQALLVIEAMKMQNTVQAPASGTIKRIHPKVGDLLAEGSVLLEFD